MTVLVKGEIKNEYWKGIVAKIDGKMPLSPDEVEALEQRANVISLGQESDGSISYYASGERWIIDLRPYFNLYWVNTGNQFRITQVAAFTEDAARAIAEYRSGHAVTYIIMVQQATKTL